MLFSVCVGVLGMLSSIWIPAFVGVAGVLPSVCGFSHPIIAQAIPPTSSSAAQYWHWQSSTGGQQCRNLK